MRITLVQGDITQQHVDAVVNAANSSLMGGGGVDGAIHRRGGPAILEECRMLRASRYGRGLPVGQAVATTAGDLPARWVIHAVGPVHSRTEDRSHLLASCYREALRVADEVGAATVALPAVSAGIYGWPVEDAARIAVATVRSARTRVAEARFVLFTPDVHAAFRRALEAAGPSDEEIAARLAAQPEERWRALFACADALTPADLEVSWRGGQELEPGVIQMPYPVYGEAVQRILGLLGELGAVVVFGWPDWVRGNPLWPDGRGLDDAPVADAARLATAIIRGERFSDGTIEQALDRGAFRAVLRRLRRWFDEERPATG
ncbi:O-acetyl-ADP-ribose deacetylase (regulator of RNase III) [Nonomuraea muscovyensis]|uniref:O-acetyl-ADP-ribose deacetylase (Regulator of RNase III) n=1 Tax=Nonomuraea muscovyensis TaxID=1124761 RepID=A0A7X0C7T4_9ACTN|nr:O-acetyl-ADP-ribose deacetylase (regulator of RNase III) [Nonomuraea muscovyensis]